MLYKIGIMKYINTDLKKYVNFFSIDSFHELDLILISHLQLPNFHTPLYTFNLCDDLGGLLRCFISFPGKIQLLYFNISLFKAFF